MGLYLTIFDGNEELEGVEIGSYADFNAFRDHIINALEAGDAGSRFPVLIIHSDCDGVWSPEESALLEMEMHTIQKELCGLPPIELPDGWQRDIAKLFGLMPSNLNDCFFDVDGEILTERLIKLAQVSQESAQAILFQ